MSKQIGLRSGGGAARACALLLCLWLGGAELVRAQVASAPSAAVNPRGAAIAAATDEVLRETSDIRKLPVLRPVKSGAQSRADIERMLIKNLDEETTPDELRASELTLKKFGLVPADFQLRPFTIKLLTEQVMGYYDPKTQIFYLADWVSLDEQQPVLAHELTHALQDQHFNLRRFENWPKGDSDAELAAHALVEGDAMLTMSFYIMRDIKRAAAMMKSMGSGSTEQIDNAPRALRESLLFPYEQGLPWVQQLYRQGGWAQVSRAFTELPQSTEQILHVNKYFAHEAPIKVNLPDIVVALGAGWRRIDYDVNGEWNYYQILAEYVQPPAADAERAAVERAVAGWGGDRYAVYERKADGRVLLAQSTVWDTEQDAQEFFEAYAQRTERRYKKAVLEQRMDETASQRLWTTEEGRVCLARQGTRVAVLEGLPTVDSGGPNLTKIMKLLLPDKP
jgi:hypothetical protein